MDGSKLEFSTCSDGTEVLKEAGPMGRFLFTVEERPGLGSDAKSYRTMLCAAPVMIDGLRSAIATLEQLVKLNRIPENVKGLRDARAALAQAEGHTMLAARAEGGAE